MVALAFVGATTAEIGIPGEVRIVGIRRRRPEEIRDCCIGEIVRINGRKCSVVVHQRQQFIYAGHPPVVVTAQLFRVATIHQAVPVVVVGSKAATLRGLASPTVGVVFVVDAAIIGFCFPDQASDIVHHAAPAGGARWQLVAAGVELGEAEPGMAVAVVVVGGVTALVAVLGRGDVAGAGGVVAFDIITPPW